jgi:hypothetical protein
VCIIQLVNESYGYIYSKSARLSGEGVRLLCFSHSVPSAIGSTWKSYAKPVVEERILGRNVKNTFVDG